MIGRVLFMSAAAFVAWRYISGSNKKVKQLNEVRGGQEVLPPEPAKPVLLTSAKQTSVKSTAQKLLSRAAESFTGR